MDSQTNTTTKFPNNNNNSNADALIALNASNVKPVVVSLSEANTVVSDDSESFDAGISFSCNNLDSSGASSSKTIATPQHLHTSSIPVIRFSSNKSPRSPSSDQLVEINFKDTDLSINSFNTEMNKMNGEMGGGYGNLGYGSGASSIRDENSSTNLLSLDNSDESNLTHSDTIIINGKRINTNINSDRKETGRTLVTNGFVGSSVPTPKQNSLRPLDKFDFNNTSQSSIDPRIKYGSEGDMIPLMPVDSSHSLSTSNNNNNNSNSNSNNSSNGNVTTQIPICELEVETSQDMDHERWYTIFLQILFPFLIAGLGMVAAGVVLDKVQHWDLYKNISAIYTLVPALLGLKGNLEMTLASRLSTQVNLGKINDKTSTLNAILGNFALTQAQAIVVGFLASMFALSLELVTQLTNSPSENEQIVQLDFKNSFVLISGSMSTASFASLILAGLMMFVIILSKKLRINPDNIATPIAASLGDLVTLTILSYLCTFLYEIKSIIWIHILITLFFLMLVPIFVFYSYKNELVKDALRHGWSPIIMAMIISSAGGAIMGLATKNYADIAAFQPVVNGVGGNLVAIFASRLSTALHRTSTQGSKAYWTPKKWYYYPLSTFFGKSNPESKTAIVLVLLSLPGHLLFYYVISKIKMFNHKDSYNAATTTPSFIIFYLYVTVLQVIILLLICYWLVHFAWRQNKNPDNICIPYLTAIGDLLGTAFLAICFHVLYLAGSKDLRKPV